MSKTVRELAIKYAQALIDFNNKQINIYELTAIHDALNYAIVHDE